MLDLGDLVGRVLLKDDQFEQVLDRLPEKLRGSGPVMALAGLGIGAAIGGALASGLATAANAEAANDKLSAQLGLTAGQAATAGAVAGGLYADAYGENIEQVNDTVAAVMSSVSGMSDAPQAELEAVTAKVLNLSTAMEIDATRAAQVAGQMISTGLAGDSTQALDLLTASLQKVPTALREDLLDATDEYGPAFAAVGLSGEEAMNLLVKSSEKGMYGIDKTGDALKEFGIRATDMSTTSGAAYQALGLDQTEYTNMLLAGGDQASDAFNTIVLGLQRIEDPAARSQAALALFGTPLEDLNVNDIPAFLSSLQSSESALGDVAGAADEMGATLNGNASTGWTQLQRTFEGIVGQVGGALLPVLTTLLTWANENPIVLQAVAAVLGVLALAFIGVTVATWAMNTALLANPITWIILAVVALIAAIVLLVMNWDMVVAWITEIWGGFIGWITEVINGFAGWWGGVWDGIVGFFTDAWNLAVAVVTAIVVGYFSFWVGIWTAIIDFFVGLWNGAINFFATIIANMVATGVAVVSGFIGWWNGAWSAVGSFFTNLWNGLIGGVQAAWGGIIGFFQGIPNTILGFFTGIGTWLYSAGQDLVNGLLEGLGSMAGQIGSFFLNMLPGWIVGPFKAALGIASPSRVFMGFGENIGEGIMVGLDRVQGDLDARVAGMVSVPPVDVALRPGSAASGAYSAAAGVSSSTTVDARQEFHGDIHVTDLDELQRQQDTRQRDAMALAGVTTLEG